MLTDPDLFTQPVDVDVPRIESPAPSAPGSRTSKLAALIIQGPMRSMSLRKVMLALATLSEPVSREQLSAMTGLKESSLCARLSELSNVFGPGMGWVEVVDGACISSAGMTVNGYRLSAVGKQRVREAQEPIEARE